MDNSLARQSTGAADRGASLYEAIGHLLPYGAVFLVDRELRYVLADGAALRDTGFAPGDFIGKRVRDAVPPEMAAQYERDYRSLLEGGRFCRQHQVNQRHFRSHGVPVPGADGQPELAFVVSYDITERVMAERQLALLHELGEALAASADKAEVLDAAATLLHRHIGVRHCLLAGVDPDGACSFDLAPAAGQGTLPEAAPLELFGTAAAARLREGATACSDELAPADCANGLAGMLGTPAFIACPHMAQQQLGGVFAVFRDTGAPWGAHERTLVECVAARAWNALARLRLAAERAEMEARKDRVLALLGHELRNPLANLTSSLELLAARAAGPDPLLGVMQRQVGQLRQLVEDLLGVSYIQLGKLELRVEPVVLQDVLDAAIDAHRAQAKAKRHRIAVGKPARPLVVEGDRAKLTQVLSNLVGNAVKYTPEGGAIAVELALQGSSARITVKDDGIGVPPAELARVFELFERGGAGQRPGERRTEAGLGIGLWIVQQLVQAHGGRVEASSEGPGRGSVFTVELPAVT